MTSDDCLNLKQGLEEKGTFDSVDIIILSQTQKKSMLHFSWFRFVRKIKAFF